MFKAGLTGGIGSGKSTVARIFRVLGVPVFEADACGRELIRKDPAVIAAIKQRFGAQVLRGAEIDRPALANMVFHSPLALADLNAIIHPAVRAAFHAWAGSQHAPYVILESAILVESGGSGLMDALIVVSAPEQLRIQRVMVRDGVEEDAVRWRMANQCDEAGRLAAADHVIRNNDRELVIPQVLAAHAAILNSMAA